MISFERWRRETRFPNKPWLILGKGPSFSYLPFLDLKQFNTISLNHVVRQVKVDIAHAIDIEVIQHCGQSLLDNCRFLVMPSIPNYRFGKGPRHLSEFLEQLDVLRRLARQNRLVVYDLLRGEHATGEAGPNGPLIEATYFSVEAAANVAAELGARNLRTLGIDGGRKYSSAFSNLNDKTLLQNGQVSFDRQFTQLHRIGERFAMSIQPAVEPMKVFVGTDDSQMVAAHVLEHSIKQHATRPVEVTHMCNFDVPLPKDEKNRPKTGFSFARFLIPQLAGFRGRALYLDADMLVFSDLAELWDIPFGDVRVMCTSQDYIPAKWEGNPNFQKGRQLSVMMIDCERVNWDVQHIVDGLDNAEYTYSELMHDLCILPQDQITNALPARWNCLEWFEPAKTSLLHYTVVPSQPWKNNENMLQDLWHGAFREAMQHGAVPLQLLEESMAKGYVKKSLLHLVCDELEQQATASDEDRELNHVRISLWDSWREIDDLQEQFLQLQNEVERLRKKQRPIKRALRKVKGLFRGKRAA